MVLRQHRWQGLSTEHCRCGQHDMLTRCGQRRPSVGVGPFVDRGAACDACNFRSDFFTERDHNYKRTSVEPSEVITQRASEQRVITLSVVECAQKKARHMHSREARRAGREAVAEAKEKDAAKDSELAAVGAARLGTRPTRARQQLRRR